MTVAHGRENIIGRHLLPHNICIKIVDITVCGYRTYALGHPCRLTGSFGRPRRPAHVHARYKQTKSWELLYTHNIVMILTIREQPRLNREDRGESRILYNITQHYNILYAATAYNNNNNITTIDSNDIMTCTTTLQWLFARA